MRTLILWIELPFGKAGEADELAELVRSAGLECYNSITFRLRQIRPRHFISAEKVRTLCDIVQREKIELVVFNHALSPSQERNLERVLQIPVRDRFALILEIFSQRASSHEGKLQVEMAQLQHLSTRLVRGWSHLERQRGGIGLRGPGEKQLETDRRLLQQRLKTIRRLLARTKRRRESDQQRRRKNSVCAVVLVGYTNAGKSTLFNCLTHANTAVADQLFVTLDPSTRALSLPSGRQVVLIDTVGFISDLPHELIQAFHATLQQVQQADLLLHVMDTSDPVTRGMHIAQVNHTISQLDADQVTQIQVHNKIDRLTGVTPGWQHSHLDESCPQIYVSAVEETGITDLLECIDITLDKITHTYNNEYQLTIPIHAGSLRSVLFRYGVVLGEKDLAEGGWSMRVKMNDQVLYRLCRKQGIQLSELNATMN